MKDDKFDLNLLPNTMAYERIRLNWNKTEKNKHLKIKIADLLRNQPTNKYYREFLSLDCPNFITTNYDYAIVDAFKNIFENSYVRSNNSEEIYSIRRRVQLTDQKDRKNTQVWYIHGEIDNPKSIMLGLNHYNGSIAKISGYLKGTYDFSKKGQKEKIEPIETKLERNRFDNFSWIELFFNSNVHIAGFGFDFSETDLWWILNKRARLNEENLISNKVYYYTKPLDEVKEDKIEVEKRKRELLESFKTDIVEFTTKNGISIFWNNVIEQIKVSNQ
jgi:hypothetical protein